MLYLHTRSPPIIHRDLKSPNLLVDEAWRVRVSDFNLSKYLTDASRSSSMAAMNPRWAARRLWQDGRPRLLEREAPVLRAEAAPCPAVRRRWLAPEVMQGQQAGPAADVFSFGVVMWELLTCVFGGQRGGRGRGGRARGRGGRARGS